MWSSNFQNSIHVLYRYLMIMPEKNKYFWLFSVFYRIPFDYKESDFCSYLKSLLHEESYVLLLDSDYSDSV